MLPEIIRTPRLLLRQWTLADVGDVFAYACDSEWGRYLPISYPYDREDAHRFVASQMALDRQHELGWAIERDGHAVGGINVRLFSEGSTAEIDYAVARACWGRGFATEAGVAVLDHAFQDLATLTKVRSMIDRRNLASARVLEKLGLRQERPSESASHDGAEVATDVWYAITRGDWESR